jgi:hypothetical protein
MCVLSDALVGLALVESVRTIPKIVWVARLGLKKMLPPKVFWFFPPHGDISNLDALFRRGW